MRAPKITAVAAATLFSISLAACGSSDSGSKDSGAAAAPTMTTAAPTMAPSTTDSMVNFGSGCAAVPADPSNKGSFQAMAQVPVATAASGNPLLSTLVTAVKQAGLVDSLNSADGITVFAPVNDAFAAIPPKTLKAVLKDKETLTKILTHHVIAGQLSPDQLAGEHETLAGDMLTVEGSGEDFMVGAEKATVLCGNVPTANATVYIIDTVLMPS